jgi:hypothetical protein
MSQPSFPLDLFRTETETSVPAEKEAAKKASLDALQLQVGRYESTGFLPTGLDGLDGLLKGGIPRGKLVEITGSLSSGKTSLLMSILMKATQEEEFVAYVDTFDSLDPDSALKAGVDLDRVLWIRCRKTGEPMNTALEKALKAVDILAQAGGFGVIALDLQPAEEQRNCRIPLHAWFRLQRALKGTPSTLLVISPFRTAGSAASLALSLERQNSRWSHRGSRSASVRFRVDAPAPAGSPAKVPLSTTGNSLQGLETQAQLLRGMPCGTVPVYCSF